MERAPVIFPSEGIFLYRGHTCRGIWRRRIRPEVNLVHPMFIGDIGVTVCALDEGA